MQAVKLRRSERVFTQIFLALVLTMASVFLVEAIYPTRVSALGSNTLNAEAVKPDPLKEQELAIEKLGEAAKQKAELVEKKANEVKAVKQEVAKVAQEKEAVASQVAEIKNEVEVLKAKVEEKKRLDALRIVPQGRNAPDSADNLYALGNCTFYVKSKRPDLSNSLGNANTWYSYAQAQGYKTGTMAKTGAVGTTTRGPLGHVVYVEKWLGEGKILISEMNVNGLWSMQTREADESEFVYIYELP